MAGVDLKRMAAALPQARPAKLAHKPVEPQLATMVAKPPEGPPWIHEVKWDGYRLMTTVVAGKARLWSRNAIEWTARLPVIVRAIEQLGLESAQLDGELIAAGGTQADFNLLQSSIASGDLSVLSYVVFDLLHINGVSVEAAPLIDRKAILATMLKAPPPRIAYSSHIPEQGRVAFELASQGLFEGIVAKDALQPYVHGRSAGWLKCKRQATETLAVVGYTPAKNCRGQFGSLLLAQWTGTEWVYAGRIGSGFTDRQIRDLSPIVMVDASPIPTVSVPASAAKMASARWFAPRFVVEVLQRGISKQGVLRQPSLKSVRADIPVGDLQLR